MSRIFVGIYRYFERRKALLYLLLAGISVVLLFFAAKVRFSEQLTNFFPDDTAGRRTSVVFDNLRVKDKIILLFSAADNGPESEPDGLIEAGDLFLQALAEGKGNPYIRSVTSEVGNEEFSDMISVIYDNLPVYLTDSDYERLQALIAPGGIEERMERNYALLVSSIGLGVRDVIARDPLGIGNEALAGLQDFALDGDYELYGNHIFSPDFSTMIMVIDPLFGMTDTGANETLVTAIEAAIATVREEIDGVAVEYVGGPSVAVYNARQIKRDTMLTLTIALIIIVVFITAVFRNKWAVPLIILPVVFGAVFSLGVMWLIGHGTISAIAVGAGAAVFGIAMSYSIHVIAHSNHIDDPETVVRELAYPLTVGSFTTIGAFLGLVLTKSQLLRDFGLFSALALTGTTIFCLVFLPHFLGKGGGKKPGRLLRIIERMNGYAFDRNKYLVGGVLLLTVASLFFYNKVAFDSDMMNLNYTPPHLEQAERKIQRLTGETTARTIFIAASDDTGKAHDAYHRLGMTLDSLKTAGVVTAYATAVDYLLPETVQAERIERWNRFWTAEQKQQVLARIGESARLLGFQPGAFDGFAEVLERNYSPVDISDEAVTGWLGNWVTVADGITLFIAQVSMDPANKEEVYPVFLGDPEVTVADRGYFAGLMAQSVSDDFYLILFICSLLIFGALLISYGRIELALMAFLPMTVSWFIILGLMALFGIEFNIVNIILSTFIFGIGDDFSIFIMDGLLNEYKDGKKLLPAHKTAIFFSAFTIVVGIGALIFARHPALQSISVISLVGMVAVVLVGFTLQPVIFRLFISARTRHGGFPFTGLSFLNTLYCFLYFVLGCFILQLYTLLLFLIPIGKKRRKLFFHRAVRGFTALFLRTMFTTKRVHINPCGETFEKPAVIIANHQSFIDILVLLSIYPKFVMVTNRWVWKSPFFGRVVRYAGFGNASEGFEEMAGKLRPWVEEGYSVIVFPEGTRSPDHTIGRFRKGAFCLARELDLDILPIVLYGNGMVSSKRQPFYIKKGLLVSEVLPRIPASDTSFGTTDRERTKQISAWFREQYRRVYEEYNRPGNPYFYDALIKNYTYKGPVLEWYMRVKLRMEKCYAFYDRCLPREGSIVDIGCGYGPLTYMLALLSDGRKITGIDYDPEKIALAARSFSRTDRIDFICADVSDYDLPPADAYLLSDMLHYLPYAAQERLLEQCFTKVLPGGKVVVKDGDSSSEKEHAVTRLTEKWSTEITGFNKAENKLCFTSTESIRAIAARSGFAVEVFDNGYRTSNKIYVATRKTETP